MPEATFANVGFGQFFVAVLLAAGLATWVYWHASKHGSRHGQAQAHLPQEHLHPLAHPAPGKNCLPQVYDDFPAFPGPPL